MAKANITASLLRKYLNYDAETGRFTWRVDSGSAKVGATAGYIDSDGALVIEIDGNVYQAEDLAWLYVIGTLPKGRISHINGDTADNRFKNLVEVALRAARTEAVKAASVGIMRGNGGRIVTVNEQLRDADISHQIDLQQYANGVVRKLIALLNRTDSDLFAQLVVALEKMSPESFNVKRLEQLLTSVHDLNTQAYAAVSKELHADLQELADYESGYQFQLFNTTLPPQIVAQVDVATVSVEQVYAAAMARPFQGRLLKEWASTIEDDRMARIRDAVRIGYVQNQSISEIVQRVRGTKAKGYSDGIIEIDRRNAEAVVRTAISHTAAFTRNRFLQANNDLIKAVVWTSTLDSRTSTMCRIRDGLQYTPDEHKPIGHKIPWLAGPGQLHWNCRSTSVPVTKSWGELGGVDIGEFNPETRASMDGQVPGDTTYADWIKKQPAGRQDEILGPMRGKLLREGGLTLDRFYNERGRYLDLTTLRERDAEAFRRAGI